MTYRGFSNVVTSHRQEEKQGEELAAFPFMQVDLNRVRVPLLEIVFEPDMLNGMEAAEYAAELQRPVWYLGVSNGILQEGSLRWDVNFSVWSLGQFQYVCWLLTCCWRLKIQNILREKKALFDN